VDVYLIEGRYHGQDDWWVYLAGPFLTEAHAEHVLQHQRQKHAGEHSYSIDFRLAEYCPKREKAPDQ